MSSIVAPVPVKYFQGSYMRNFKEYCSRPCCAVWRKRICSYEDKPNGIVCMNVDTRFFSLAQVTQLARVIQRAWRLHRLNKRLKQLAHDIFGSSSELPGSESDTDSDATVLCPASPPYSVCYADLPIKSKRVLNTCADCLADESHPCICVETRKKSRKIANFSYDADEDTDVEGSKNNPIDLTM